MSVLHLQEVLIRHEEMEWGTSRWWIYRDLSFTGQKVSFIPFSQITAVSLETGMYDMEQVTMDMVITCSIAVAKNTYLACYLIVSSLEIFDTINNVRSLYFWSGSLIEQDN